MPGFVAPSARRKFSWAAAVVVLLALSGFGYYYFGGSAPVPERSIAVLPFTNMSNDPEQEYFSDGMTDEVLNRLYKIGDLKVISRTSSMKFKGAKLTAGEIADQLGVVNILEGSVQKSGNRVKITVQLIDATNDVHLWSETYEREFKDVFAIQAEIAQAVAKGLKAKLSISAQRRLEEIPTQNQVAYEYYLKGLQQATRYVSGGGEISSTVTEINLYTKAIEEDSLFAQARFHRAAANLWIYWLGSAKEKAQRDLHVALADKDIAFLKQWLPESIPYKQALALRHYWVDRNYDEAMKLYLEILDEDPGDWISYSYVANLQRRQGRWSESTKGLERSLKADPLNESAILQLVYSYYWTRQFEKARELCKFAIPLSPNSPFRLFMVYTLVAMGTDLNTAIKESGLSPEALNSYAGVDFQDPGNTSFLDARRSKGDVERVEQQAYVPIEFDYSIAHFLKGDRKLARTYADSAISLVSERLGQMPDDFRIYATLGQCYALAGNEELALRNANKAISLMPITQDAFWGTRPERDFAETCVLLGKYDLAMDKIEMLLSIPNDVSVGWLLVHPVYAPLRELPRFKRLVNKYKYQETSLSKPN